MNGTDSQEFPVIVGYYAGDDYYYKAGEQLRQDCDDLGLEHDIVEAPLKKPFNWIEGCRYKVKLIGEMLEKHKRPIMYVDVDTRILARPEPLRSTQADIGFFLRGFKPINEYDPGKWARVMGPALLYFGYTPLAREYVQLLQEVEAKFKGRATDDYFLQETWVQFTKPLAILVLSPDLVSFDDPKPGKGSACFYLGLSGSMPGNKMNAQQHVADPHSVLRRKAVFQHEAAILGRQKRYQEAIQMMERAHAADPHDELLAYDLARLMRDHGQMNKALSMLGRIKDSKQLDHAARFQVDTDIQNGGIARAKAVAEKLLRHGQQADKDWAASRLLRIGLEERAHAKGIKHADRPALWWIEAPYPGNFGDMLNPYMIEKLTGIPPYFATRDQAILAIGSTIKFAMPNTHVWGTGTPRMTDRLNASAHYHAVRGPLTRQLVLESGGQCPEVYGDPAWFLPQIYQPKPTGKKYKLGLIRHYTNEGEIKTSKDVLNIPLLRAGYQGIEDFIDELNSCEAILTTSLHGLIVAHAYGIPARWCEVVDAKTAIAGDGTKHHDYMMSVGIKPEPPLELHKDTLITLDWVKEAQRLPKKQIDLTALANAAPFKITAKWGRANPKLVGKPLQTDKWHGQVATFPSRDKQELKELISRIDARFLNYGLRKLYSRLR